MPAPPRRDPDAEPAVTPAVAAAGGVAAVAVCLLIVHAIARAVFRHDRQMGAEAAQSLLALSWLGQFVGLTLSVAGGVVLATRAWAAGSDLRRLVGPALVVLAGAAVGGGAAAAVGLGVLAAAVVLAPALTRGGGSTKDPTD